MKLELIATEELSFNLNDKWWLHGCFWPSRSAASSRKKYAKRLLIAGAGSGAEFFGSGANLDLAGAILTLEQKFVSEIYPLRSLSFNVIWLGLTHQECCLPIVNVEVRTYIFVVIQSFDVKHKVELENADVLSLNIPPPFILLTKMTIRRTYGRGVRLFETRNVSRDFHLKGNLKL